LNTLEKYPTFTYILSFEISVWLTIVLTLLLLGVVLSISKKSFQHFILHVWQYSAVLLSEPFPNSAYKKSLKYFKTRILLAVWLLACTVFLSAFSGVLRGFFIQKMPCKCIDTWDQLYERKDLKIITVDMMYFARYVDNYKHVDDMARDFYKRTEIRLQIFNDLDYLDYVQGVFQKKLKSGKYVIVLTDIVLYTWIFDYDKQPSKSYIKILKNDDLYVSKDCDAVMPYTLVLSERIKSQLENDINTAYVVIHSHL